MMFFLPPALPFKHSAARKPWSGGRCGRIGKEKHQNEAYQVQRRTAKTVAKNAKNTVEAKGMSKKYARHCMRTSAPNLN
jgi:hypothetical protein